MTSNLTDITKIRISNKIQPLNDMPDTKVGAEIFALYERHFRLPPCELTKSTHKANSLGELTGTISTFRYRLHHGVRNFSEFLR